MGGHSSKHTFKEDPVVPRDVTVKGLKKGDVVTIRGEACPGSLKLFYIDFMMGKDVAFHFKVILTETEGHFNMVKMNTLIDGKWGAEEFKDNIIYLNRHFELKFNCLEDKFSVDVDGNHFCDYKHRVSAEKITSIHMDGNAVWKFVDVPKENVVPKGLSSPATLQLSTDEDIKVFVEGLYKDSAPVNVLRSTTNESEITHLSDAMIAGLQSTQDLLKDDKGGVLKNVMTFAEYLTKTFAAGQAIFGIVQFVIKFGEPSNHEQLIKKLNEINEQLKKIEAKLEQGFAELIEHMDFTQFRESVKIPVRTLFDLYIRCYTVRGKAPLEDFKKHCADHGKSPRDIFSAMYEFLDSKKNIFETHLKTKKYVYSVYEDWTEALFNYASKLIVMNMFYYGIASEQHKADGHNDALINEKDEIQDLIKHVQRMDKRLKEIELERLKSFHKGGYAKEFLREKFKGLEYPRGSAADPLPRELLPAVAYQMKQRWIGFNGPHDFMIMVVRGAYGKENQMVFTKDSMGFMKHAGWHIGDAEKVTVVDNIGTCSDAREDQMCLALIQPITPEMRKINENVFKEHKDKISEGLMRSMDGRIDLDCYKPSVSVEIAKKLLPSIPHKPLLVLYNEEHNQQWGDRDKVVDVVPFHYMSCAEAWSAPAGPFPLKCHVRYKMSYKMMYNREFQFLFH